MRIRTLYLQKNLYNHPLCCYLISHEPIPLLLKVKTYSKVTYVTYSKVTYVTYSKVTYVTYSKVTYVTYSKNINSFSCIYNCTRGSCTQTNTHVPSSTD